MASVIARVAIVPVLAQPTLRAEQVSQLVLGETGRARGRAGDVAADRGRLRRLRGVGPRRLRPRGERRRRRGRGARRPTAGALGAIVADRRAARCGCRSARGWRSHGSGRSALPDGRRGTAGEWRRPTVAEQTARAARADAGEHWALEHFAGAPYLWGGVTPWGVDCSGLVQTTFAARGIVLPRDSAQQADMRHAGAARTRSGRATCSSSAARAATGITHVAFAGAADTLIHSTVACGGVRGQEPWLPGAARGRRCTARLVGGPAAGGSDAVSMPLKLVLFDIDGTLLLTAGAGRRAIVAALAEEVGDPDGVRPDPVRRQDRSADRARDARGRRRRPIRGTDAGRTRSAGAT